MSPPSAPLDPGELEVVARALTRTRWSAAIYDAEWRLSWLSPELIGLLGSDDEQELGVGEHVLAVFRRAPWRRAITDESRLRMLGENLDFILHDTPGGKQTAARYLDEAERELLEGAQPRTPPPVWAYGIDYVPAEGPTIHVHTVTVPLRREGGPTFANAVLYNTGLPASLLAQLVRGDRGMFERMARLADPGQHAAAILFADVEQSGMLSRHVPSARYFALIRRLTNAMDQAIVERTGIVGKHAGDGASGFFLADDLGSGEAAIEAAIEAAREIMVAAEAAGNELRIDLPGSEPVRINAGVHWAPAAYIGQVATEGRLEVTALGDEVNECARIQEAARGGALLASKTALELISPEVARALGLDAEHLRYTTVAEIPDVSDKARRDAGSIAVTPL